MTQIPELRHAIIEVRAGDTDSREFTGIGVPYGDVVEWWSSFFECFDPGSVHLADDVPPLVLWQHDSKMPIGTILAGRDTAAGFEITGRLSTTPDAQTAYTLLKDGTVTRLSIGFIPRAWEDVVVDGVTTRHYTDVIAREFSLVSFPFYPTASITDVRNEPTKEGPAMPTDTITPEDLTEVRQSIEDLTRRFDTFTPTPPTPPVDNRSAGEVLKALVAGDSDTIRAYEEMLERAYEGGTSADAILKPGWVGNLVRIFDASSGVLAETFSTGPLPDAGMSIEFAELDTNSIAVNEQAAEGDDITMGNVKITTRTAPVKTFAGGTQLTRQEIERATVGVLDTSLEALAMAAGIRKKLVLRAAYNALVAQRQAIADDAGVLPLGATLAASTVDHWENLLIDAAIRFELNGLPLEKLLASKTVFKKLRSLTVAGERVFKVAEDNHSGTLSLPGLSGQFAGLPVRLDTGQLADAATFCNSRAIRQRDSALVSLSDESIVNLSKTFAVYRYGAVAAEIPAGVVPVKLA